MLKLANTEMHMWDNSNCARTWPRINVNGHDRKIMKILFQRLVYLALKLKIILGAFVI